MSRTYSDKEKIAYYKAKAVGAPAIRAAPARRAAPVRRPTVVRSTYRATKPLPPSNGFRAAAPKKLGSKKYQSKDNFGGDLGASLGRALGHGAQQLFKMVTGFGDYKVENNSLLEGGMTPPQIVNSIQNNGVIIRHREYIKDINASQDFTLESFDINPGVSTTFPWLASVSSAYEQYSFRGLIFEIKSLASDAVLSTSASSALGSVMMATSYNVLDPDFTTKSQMLNYEFANSAKPSLDFIHPVECASHLTSVDTQYVRTGAIPPDADQRLYDLGNFQVATVGMQAVTGVVSELWATYEVFLTKPKFGAIGRASVDQFSLVGPWTTQPLGTSSSAALTNNIGGFLTGGTAYNFPTQINSGTYVITYSVIGDVAVAVQTPTSVIGSNCSLITQIQGPADGGTSRMWLEQYMVEVTGQSAKLTFGGGTFPTTNVVGMLSVVPYLGSSLSVEPEPELEPEEIDDIIHEMHDLAIEEPKINVTKDDLTQSEIQSVVQRRSLMRPFG